jgi:hypothetical protein
VLELLLSFRVGKAKQEFNTITASHIVELIQNLLGDPAAFESMDMLDFSK